MHILISRYYASLMHCWARTSDEIGNLNENKCTVSVRIKINFVSMVLQLVLACTNKVFGRNRSAPMWPFGLVRQLRLISSWRRVASTAPSAVGLFGLLLCGCLASEFGLQFYLFKVRNMADELSKETLKEEIESKLPVTFVFLLKNLDLVHNCVIKAHYRLPGGLENGFL